MTNTRRRKDAIAQLAGALVIATLTLAVPRQARATQFIPSLGITKSTDTNAGDAQGFGGVAVRAPVLPFLNLEGGISYRQESLAGGAVKVRQWPVTASAWVTPFPMIYAGGGLGWYRTTIDYRGNLAIEDVTTQKVGVHLGGGAMVPMSPKVGLDLNGRYIFMTRDRSELPPQEFNPDYWSTSLGLAIKF